MRLSVTAKKNGHDVKVFLIGEAVEIENLNHTKYDVAGQIKSFYELKGEILACGTCLKSRNMESTEVCPLSTMNDCNNITWLSGQIRLFRYRFFHENVPVPYVQMKEAGTDKF